MVLRGEPAADVTVPRPTGQSAPGRMTWMDLLRGTAVLLVAVWHCVAVPDVFGGPSPSGIIGDLNNVLSPFRIPTLLVLSGLLLDHSLSKGFARYVSGKVRRIVWPLLLWGALIALSAGSPQSIISLNYWAGASVLWYLSVLVFCYAAALLRPRCVPWWVTVVAPLAILWIVQPSTNAYIRILWFGAFFFLGATLRRAVPVLQDRIPVWAAALLFALGLGGGAVVAAGHIDPQTPPFFLISVIGIIAVIVLAPHVPDGRGRAFLETVGRSSIVLYVGHAFVMFLIAHVAVTAGLDHPVVLPLVLLAAGVGVPLLMIRHRERIEWMFTFPQVMRRKELVDARV